MKRRDLYVSKTLAVLMAGLSCCPVAMEAKGDSDAPHLQASAYRKQMGAVVAAADTNLYVEAEECTVGGAWQALPWGRNYYAATFANTFMSRQAYLGAPPQCDVSESRIDVVVPEAGDYLLLARYESPYRFETRFRVTIEQTGKTAFDRMYGGVANEKIWAFGKGITNQVAWSWGAAENVVWEGHDARATLRAGPAVIRLIAGPQPEPAACRNVDLLILTRDEADIAHRIAKERYLPLDGLLTQQGDLFMRICNGKDSAPVRLAYGTGVEHSPYWVHMRKWARNNMTPLVAPGAQGDWIEVGSLLDTLNAGQWTLNAQPESKDAKVACRVEFALPGAAAGSRDIIASFEQQDAVLELAYFGDTRYRRRLIHRADVLDDLLEAVRQATPSVSPPKRFPIFAYTFEEPGPRAFLGEQEAAHRRASIAAFNALFGLKLTHGVNQPFYLDLRSVKTEKLTEHLRSLEATHRNSVMVVSLGDEIGLPMPPKNSDAAFRNWLLTQNIPATDLSSHPTSMDQLAYDIGTDCRTNDSKRYYWSRRYANAHGIAALRERTDLIRRELPNAGIGANFSPHHGGSEHAYIGPVHTWVTLFREGGMTMPWSEDYAWQLPIGSQQLNALSLDLFRAGLRHKPQASIHFYVMPHWPGTTPNMWRRQFYTSLAHGMKMLNLFEFRPVQDAYTENHVSLTETYVTVRRALGELATFEDFIVDGTVAASSVGLWFSEVSDIWRDNAPPYAAAKRALYLALRHGGPLDVVVEADALDGTLKTYATLYLADRHISRAASSALAAWVRQGGKLLVTAGAGARDEFDQPNTIMKQLLGASVDRRTDGAGDLHYLKQDLPFANAVDTVHIRDKDVPVFGATSTLDKSAGEILATFSDHSPAMTHRAEGAGEVSVLGFLPGLSYMAQALPKRPVDRGADDSAFTHFLPTNFNATVAELIAAPASKARALTCSDGLVDFNLIQSKHGVVVPLASWRDNARHTITLHWRGAPAVREARLASGGKVDIKPVEGATLFTFDLTLADALILKLR